MGTEKYLKPILDYLNDCIFCRTYFTEGMVIARDSQINDKLLTKSITKIFPSNSDLCVILDDRLDVWEEKESLLNIEPFFFFKDTKPANIQYDAKDCFLEVMSQVLNFIWNVFYKAYESKSIRTSVKVNQIT